MANDNILNANLIIPIGTHIVTLVDVKGAAGGRVCPRGAVAEIIAAPHDNSHSYRVRFAEGTRAALRRQEFAIRKHHQAREMGVQENLLTDLNLHEHVIYSCIVGSRAYGLDNDSSDIDRRGIYLAPAIMHWSLYGVPEQLENKNNQECYWEIQKFLMLALKANPTVLECLYTSLVEESTALASELLNMRTSFLSQLIYQTYNGYVMSQFKKIEQDLRGTGQIKWKHAMHLVRLLLQGIIALKDGFLPVHVEEHRDHLLAIRRGELLWQHVNMWRLALHKEFDAAFASTKLPERPDYEKVNAFLIKARRESAAHEEQNVL